MSHRTEDDTPASLGGFYRYRNRNNCEQVIERNPRKNPTSYENRPGNENYRETREESGTSDVRFTSANNYNNIEVDESLHESNRNLIVTRAPTVGISGIDQNDGFRETYDEPSGKSELSIDSQEMYALRMMQTKQKTNGDKREVIHSNTTSKLKWPWKKSKSKHKNDVSSAPNDYGESNNKSKNRNDDFSAPNDYGKINNKSKNRNDDSSAPNDYGANNNANSNGQSSDERFAWVRSYSSRAGSVYFGKSISDLQRQQNNTDHVSDQSRTTEYTSHYDDGNFVKNMTAKLDRQRQRFMSDMRRLYGEFGSSESPSNISDSYTDSDATTESEDEWSTDDMPISNINTDRDQSVDMSIYNDVEFADSGRNKCNHSLSVYSDVSGSFDEDDKQEWLPVIEKKKVNTITKGLGTKVKPKTTVRHDAVKKTSTNPKNKAKKRKEKKKARFQTIGMDKSNTHPRKTDPRTKVMRINKITRQGFITAKFTTIDPLNTPLHVACLFHYPTDFILEHLLNHDENAIATENSSCELPIHYAAMDTKGVDPAVFDALIRKYPNSIYHENIEGSLPIHVACQTGAPSIFVIEKLLDMCPEQVFAKTRLQVPVIHSENMFDEDEGNICYHGCWFDLFSSYAENLDQADIDEQFEYDWTPLHLAVLNGAPPLVIETIINTNTKCLEATTNRGRTPMTCAKELCILSIMNNAPLEHVHNIFYAIEVMQSYEIDKRTKDELKIKAEFVRQALNSSDSYGWVWADTMLTGENFRRSFGLKHNEETEEIEPGYEMIKGLTALHRAVLRREDPETIQILIQQSPECIDLVSRAQKISPFTLSKDMLIKGIQSEDLVSSNLHNTFEAFKMMQAYKHTHGNQENETNAMVHLRNWKAKNQKTFGSISDKYEYIKGVIAIDQSGKSLLGNYVIIDGDEALKPYDYLPPVDLNYVNLTLTVNVGFRRLRKAFLSNKSVFLTHGVLSNALGYQNVQSMVWDRHGKNIGDARLNDRERCSDYIGARKVFSYVVPKCNTIDAHIVYESMEIIEYNNYCFGVVSVLKEPDVPNGSEYETKLQTVFIDKGRNSCKMICSSQFDTVGMRQNVDDDWQIRKVSKYRASRYFAALAETILRNSGDGSRRRI